LPKFKITLWAHSPIVRIILILNKGTIMQTADYWIQHLKLDAHPEGGFYRETYRSRENIQLCGLPSRFPAPRSFSTAIYFLLRSQDKSLFHRIKSDELWHFHAGSTLHLYVLQKDAFSEFRLGNNPENGDSLQVVIPANAWFGARVPYPEAYTLSSCTVAPGFDFKDFEIAERASLIREFPNQSQIISELTN
jgi:predicted cupin superfamily sugar epimerase